MHLKYLKFKADGIELLVNVDAIDVIIPDPTRDGFTGLMLRDGSRFSSPCSLYQFLICIEILVLIDKPGLHIVDVGFPK